MRAGDTDLRHLQRSAKVSASLNQASFARISFREKASPQCERLSREDAMGCEEATQVCDDRAICHSSMHSFIPLPHSRITGASFCNMAVAVDPTYPLYPIACVISAAMLFLVLFNSIIRQSWNLGVAFLCFWLFFENLANGIGAVIWADNATIKLYVYCDIVTHMQLITFTVKPMATLIITRRLYLIASLHSVEPPTKAAHRMNLAIEWILGFVFPVLVAGPLYYVVQLLRFEVEEGFGCINAQDGSVLDILLLWSWTVIPPLLSIVLYYPRVIRLFYRQRRDVNHFVHSNNSVSRTNYIRIFALASIDIFLTLPIGIVSIVLAVENQLSNSDLPLPFYRGWAYDHDAALWEPLGYTYAQIKAVGPFTLAQHYFTQWSSPVLAFTIFGLFGVSSEARGSYWRAICTVGGWVGWRSKSQTRSASSSIGDIKFGERPLDLELGSQISYVDIEARLQKQGSPNESEDEAAESKNISAMKIIEEPKETIGETADAALHRG
ncbi:STE3-domain-containing protein [Peniophora sp. CONT]|nr:STE3-domain-containing protein [Peniophora sp. CONT]